MLMRSVCNASNLPLAGGFRRKAEIYSAIVLSRVCTAWWYLVSSAMTFFVIDYDSRRENHTSGHVGQKVGA